MLCLLLAGCGRMPEFIEVDGQHYIALRADFKTSESKACPEFDYTPIEEFRFEDFGASEPQFLWQPHRFPGQPCCYLGGGPFDHNGWICPCPEVTP